MFGGAKYIYNTFFFSPQESTCCRRTEEEEDEIMESEEIKSLGVNGTRLFYKPSFAHRK